MKADEQCWMFVEQQKMAEKASQKTVTLDNTKITSLIHYRSGEMSDATRLMRKEEFFKRKLKTAFELNAALEKDIKNHQTEIKDERSGISFQLNDLLKELSIKFDYFIEEKLERCAFKSNESSHSSIGEMMQKYEKIEDECLLLKRIYESLDNINTRYVAHSQEMEQLVINVESSSRQYEETMENSLNDINEEIKKKIADNERIQTHTQQLVKQIDGFVEGVVLFKQEQMRLLGKIQKLKKMATRQQQKVNQIKQWAEIIIDKNNRQLVYSTLSEKEQDLSRLKFKNDQLQMYLNELEAEQRFLTRINKENSMTSRGRSTPKAKKKQERVTFKQGK